MLRDNRLDLAGDDVLGIVVNSPRRSLSIRRAVGRAGVRQPGIWVGEADEILRDPLEAPWHGVDGQLRATVELPAEPDQSSPILGPLCLLDPDTLEAFQQPPAALARAVGSAPHRP